MTLAKFVSNAIKAKTKRVSQMYIFLFHDGCRKFWHSDLPLHGKNTNTNTHKYTYGFVCIFYLCACIFVSKCRNSLSR